MTLKGHDNWVRGLAFHPAGKYLLSVSDDRSIRCWDLSQRGRCVKVVQDAHHHFISCIRWAPSIASSNDATQPFGEARSPAASMGPASAAGSALAGRGLKANRLLSLSAANNPAAKKSCCVHQRTSETCVASLPPARSISMSKSGCNKKEKSGLFYFFFCQICLSFLNLCFLVVFFVFSLMKGYDFLSFFSLLILILYMSVWLFFSVCTKKKYFFKIPPKNNYS